jgi:hypothetical protein
MGQEEVITYSTNKDVLSSFRMTIIAPQQLRTNPSEQSNKPLRKL